ncbi:MAG: response regulator transcription factor [Desulfobacteraceae bacterium]|nr:response regulator transcription factor [Desulfobacteraceae bacterium]
MIEDNTIVIAEEQTLVREGLCALLSADGRYRVIGEAEDGLQAVRCVNQLKPDLVLMNLSMTKMSGISAIREIKRHLPKIKIIVLTLHTTDEHILGAFNAGADGYCLKNDTQVELLTAIRCVLEGKKYLSPEISGKILDGYLERRSNRSNLSLGNLTLREIEVLKLVAEGHTSPQIGSFLNISPKTVDKHRANIMKKLDLHTAAALTAYAINKGLAAPLS